MDLGFSGDVVDFYDRYRRGYPASVIDSLVTAFDLTGSDVVLDLGCGTGQLTLPMARRVGAVVGMDPEPDMLARARHVVSEQGGENVSWVLGSDIDVPGLASLVGNRSLGAVTVGQALHWMDHDRLFRMLAPLCRHGGGVAVVANGTPLWLQDNDWSRALRQWLEHWLGVRLISACGTDRASEDRYVESLAAAGFQVAETSVDYTDELDADRIVGGVYSAMSAEQLPPAEQRALVSEKIRAAVEPHRPFSEQVHVSVITGRIE